MLVTMTATATANGPWIEPARTADVHQVLADHPRYWGERDLRSLHLLALVQEFGPTYHPSNVYRSSSWLPVEVRRVAVLPLTTTITSAPFLEAGVDTLEPLVYAELEKAKRFEVIPVTPKQMKE